VLVAVGASEALSQAMDTPAEQLREMGRAGRAYVQRKFGWRTIAESLFNQYQRLLAGR